MSAPLSWIAEQQPRQPCPCESGPTLAHSCFPARAGDLIDAPCPADYCIKGTRLDHGYAYGCPDCDGRGTVPATLTADPAESDRGWLCTATPESEQT